MNAQPHDITITGGGLVGASLACALAPLGFRVAVIEAVAAGASSQPSYDDRTLALSQASCQILEGLDLWPDLAGRATAIRKVVVSELSRPGRVELDPGELGLESFGHVVEARAFGSAVMQKLNSLDNVEIIRPATVKGIRTDEELVYLEIERQGRNEVVAARLAAAADGAHSTIRQLMEIPVCEKDYGQSAVICNITPEIAHEGRAFERMTPTGPFAILPHVADRCGLVWTVSNEDAEGLMSLREDAFLERAGQRSGGELGSFLKMGKRTAYALKLVRVEQDVWPRVVILGNAAHTIHPVGAQGFNLGLRDVAALAEVYADGAREGCLPDPGDANLLRTYSEWRRPDHEGTIAYTDGMARLFSSTAPVSKAVRSFGLMAHALLLPLRRQLASRAMGYRGRPPRLALGERLFQSPE